MIIREKDWARVRDILGRVLPSGVEVWAYGSRVRGDAHEGSDLDLALLSKDGNLLPSRLIRSLKECFIDSNIPIIVEVRDKCSLPENFQEEIEREGVLVFEK